MPKAKSKKRSSEKPFNFYGIRETRNPKYMSVTLVREDEDGEREWINVPVNVKNIKAKGDDTYLKLKFLSDDEDEDEVDYNEVSSLKSNAKPKSKPKSKPKKSKYEDDEDEDLPF